ncbi:MBL fold metallo-hydrolase [Sulfodiicoccus acidiphilus]|nr:MBL fold metallo-hydrolase [Sulfodiicoccus acidiphilus]
MISLDSVTVDPHDGGSIGLPRPVAEAEVCLVTHPHYDHDACHLVGGRQVVRFYGSATFSGLKVSGLRVYHDRENGRRRGEVSIYSLEKSSFRLVHLGDLGHWPSESTLKEISSPDLLAVPVGGVITIDGKEAARLVRTVQPKAVVPIHYWVRGHLMPLDDPTTFQQELGWEQKTTKNLREDEISSKTVYLPV